MQRICVASGVPDLLQIVPAQYTSYLRDAQGYKSGDLSKGMQLPDGHPPVFSAAGIASQHREQARSGLLVKQLTLFHNCTVWTADAQVKVECAGV